MRFIWYYINEANVLLEDLGIKDWFMSGHLDPQLHLSPSMLVEILIARSLVF
jgi:hypothetical protein